MHKRRVCNFAARRRSRSAPPRHPARGRYVVEAGLLACGLLFESVFPGLYLPSEMHGLELAAHSCGGSADFTLERAASDRPPASLLASYELDSPKTTTPLNMSDWIGELRRGAFGETSWLRRIRGGKLVRAPWLCQAIAEHHGLSPTMRLFKSSLGVASAICILPKGRKSLNIPSTEGLDANTNPSCEVVW